MFSKGLNCYNIPASYSLSLYVSGGRQYEWIAEISSIEYVVTRRADQCFVG
jgi:hypothetical protein